MRSALTLPDPPDHLKTLSQSLGEQIADAILANGPMPFDEYMQRILYEPELGYYANGLHKFGGSGDFVTAPEQGPLFARALGASIEALAERWEGDWSIMEVGAGSGALARDLLDALEHPPKHYWILETSAALRAVQQETLAGKSYRSQIEWCETPPQTAWRGIVLANEVMDALPVKRWFIEHGQIRELCVQIEGSGPSRRLGWITQSPSPRLGDEVEALAKRLGHPIADGYESECCLTLAPWIEALTEHLTEGLAWLIDYGYLEPEYYHPDRSMGTVVCHYRHRAHFDPFIWPGLTDVSAFVNFTEVQRAGQDLGLQASPVVSQAEFMLGSGLYDEILDLDDEIERLNRMAEFKRLTLPGEMGEKFKMITLSRGLPPSIGILE